MLPLAAVSLLPLLELQACQSLCCWPVRKRCWCSLFKLAAKGPTLRGGGCWVLPWCPLLLVLSLEAMLELRFVVQLAACMDETVVLVPLDVTGAAAGCAWRLLQRAEGRAGLDHSRPLWPPV